MDHNNIESDDDHNEDDNEGNNVLTVSMKDRLIQALGK